MPSDRIDTEIHRLFAELDEASPPPPARPTIPARSIRTYWWRALPVAVAALVVVFVAGAVVLTDGGEESASDTTIPVAAGVTPTTTVTGAEDPSGESAAELGPSPTRPTGRIVVLTDLNIVCLGFVTAADSALPESPIGPSGHYDAIGKITDPLARLVEGFSAVEDATDDPNVGSLVETARRIDDDLTEALGDVPGNAEAHYVALSVALADLGTEAANFGAEECTALAGVLP